VIDVDLNGFETAVFHVFPLDSCDRPLLAGAEFSVEVSGNNCEYRIYNTSGSLRFLNPRIVTDMVLNGEQTNPVSLSSLTTAGNALSYKVSQKLKKDKFVISVTPDTSNGNRPAGLALLLVNTGDNKDFPEVEYVQNGKKLKVTTEKIKGKWAWFSATPDTADGSVIKVTIAKTDGYDMQLWVNNVNERKPYVLKVKTATPQVQPVLPPLPYPSQEKRDYVLLKRF
jgi:hypothetical protein